MSGYYKNGYVSGVDTKVYRKDGTTLLYSGTSYKGKPCGMGQRVWPCCTYTGEFNSKGLPSGVGSVVALDGTVVLDSVFDNGCLARPMTAEEFDGGGGGANVFSIVARGGTELKQLLNASDGFRRIVAARTHFVLGYKTALHVAVESGHLGTVMLLIESGACDPWKKDYLGRTAKESAVWCGGRPRVVELLTMLEGVTKTTLRRQTHQSTQ